MTIVTNVALIQTIELHTLLCISYFLMVPCVLVQSLFFSSVLFIDDKVPHVIVSDHVLSHSVGSTSSTSSIKQLTLHITEHFASPFVIVVAEPSNL